jgi:peptidoglycan/xylan/chitin deacetylase (PgdA/CDA1 family)
MNVKSIRGIFITVLVLTVLLILGYVLNHFKQYHHNGAIILMHNDSESNKDAMREVILYLKDQGYRFGTLDELFK